MWTASDLAHALRRGGEIDEAEALYRETLHGWQHAGNRGAIANQLECFAFVAMAKNDLVRAARQFGAAEAIREVAEAAMVPVERAEYDAAIGQLRNTLDTTALDSAWADGRRLTTDEAVSRPSPPETKLAEAQADVIVGLIEVPLARLELSPKQYERGWKLAMAGLEQASRESPPGRNDASQTRTQTGSSRAAGPRHDDLIVSVTNLIGCDQPGRRSPARIGSYTCCLPRSRWRDMLRVDVSYGPAVDSA